MAPQTVNAVLPPPVRPGDRVGVAALSGPADPTRLESGCAALEALGFEPVLASNLSRREGFYAGRDEERLAAFHALAADGSLKAMFFLRGGYGLTRVLPEIDWDVLARHPRAYVGYSDLTPFLHEVTRRLGLVAFHGPMVAADLARGLLDEERDSLLACLAGELPRVMAVEVADADRDRPAVSGPLAGGCLSLLTAVLGTPWAPALDGSLLFVEDVDEPLYRLDRQLIQLRLSGTLAGIHGMIFGHLGCLDASEKGSLACIGPLRDTVGGLGWPVAWGLAAGHDMPNLTLPLGLSARLEPGRGRLVLGASE